MADTKKKTNKKTTSKSKAKGKKSNQKRKSNVSFYEAHRSVFMLCYLAVSLFFMCIAFIPGVNVWASIKGGFFAFFGAGFYVFNFCMFVVGIRIALDNLKKSVLVTTLAGTLLTVVFSSLVYLITTPSAVGSFGNQLSAAAAEGFGAAEKNYCLSGGILGAFTGGGLLNTCGRAAGFVIIAILLVVSIILYLNISFSTVSDSVSNAINVSKEKIDTTSEATKQRLSERKEQREIERQQRAEERERLRLEEEERRQEEERSRNFDFNSTEIELEDDFSVRKKRAPKPYVSSDRLFTFVERPEEEQFVETEDVVYPQEPIINDEPDLPEGYEEIVDAEESEPEVEVEVESESEAEADAFLLVDEAISEADKAAEKNKNEVKNYVENKNRKKEYSLPPIDCLKEPDFSKSGDIAGEMKVTAKKLVDTLKSFGVDTTLTGVSRGPSVTRYELQPAPGVKISKITNLSDDIALNLASTGVRIEAPIPNKSAVGIEVPNQTRSSVTLREIIASSEFKNSKSKLNVALGKDISGEVNCTDIAKMPHLLIAGTTGSGKSVCLNCMICSILYNAKPDEVKLLMIDPKQVEFSVYNGIPHLLVPVISDVRKAAGSLAWAVGEMENRYKTFSACGVRDIGGFNKYIVEHPELEYMPQIVIFIDELNDLMMISPKEVEDSICRLAQKARAAGMHLVVATQRPSVDVITGIIKANIPSRLSLSVSSQVDSRTILDCIGAEKLLGNGDMLFNPVGTSKPVRIQGAYISEDEIEKIVDYIKDQAEVEYDDDVMQEIERQAVQDKKKNSLASAGDEASEGGDAMLDAAIDVVVESQAASTTLLQRKLRLGYARAARIMDELEQKGVVGPAEGSKPRKVLMTKAQLLEIRASKDYSEDDNSSDDFDILSD